MKKNPEFESSYYYAPADRRSHKGLVTVKRDSQGLQADVQLLEELLERPQTTEREIHRFFEEHPSILMQARLGIPIAHPRYRVPNAWSPDFAVTSVLGPYRNAELLELKGPAERLLIQADSIGDLRRRSIKRSIRYGTMTNI